VANDICTVRDEPSDYLALVQSFNVDRTRAISSVPFPRDLRAVCYAVQCVSILGLAWATMIVVWCCSEPKNID